MAKIERTPLQIEIISYIKKYIHDNDLKAGDRLPSQADLLLMMGVSRTALREAIKTLEAKEILEIKNGKGVYVKDNFKESLSRQINFEKEQQSIIEILEVRNALEREMLVLIVRNCTEQELKYLGKTVRILMEKYNRGERQNVEDKEFHKKLYRMCHHKLFEQLLEFLGERMEMMWEFPLEMESPFTSTIPYHQDLYNALCKRNIKKAIEINKLILSMELKEVKGL